MYICNVTDKEGGVILPKGLHAQDVFLFFSRRV